MDDDRLKEVGGGGCFKELMERIRDIWPSEKVFYCQVLENAMYLQVIEKLKIIHI